MSGIQWSFKSTRDCEVAEFKVGKLIATVQDCDGDFSVFVISNGVETLILSGEIYDCPGMPYHFDTAKQQCVEELIKISKPLGLYKENQDV